MPQKIRKGADMITKNKSQRTEIDNANEEMSDT